MIRTLTISRVSATNKKADGTFLKNKFGPFYRVGIQVEEELDFNGDPVWINGFAKEKPTWGIGDKITLDITEEEYNGEKRLVFKMPKGGASRTPSASDSGLESRVKALENEVFGKKEAVSKEVEIEIGEDADF